MSLRGQEAAVVRTLRSGGSYSREAGAVSFFGSPGISEVLLQDSILI